MSKSIKILVIISVVINILLIGVIFGQVSHRLGRKDLFQKRVPEIAVKLPADKKALFFRTMERVHRENRDIHKRIRETRERTLDILTAPEFDEDGYQTEAEKLHKLRGLIMQRLADATKELAVQFDQEERKALAEHLRHPPRPPRWGKRLRGGEPPPRHEGPPPAR